MKAIGNNFSRASRAGTALAGLLGLIALAGCAVAGPPAEPGYAYDAGPDDYIYYPGYEVYYSRVHHEYVYRDGDAWVRRPTPPPRVTVNVLETSPAVPMNFHDHPSAHHAAVVHDYPRNWQPPQGHPPPSARKQPPPPSAQPGVPTGNRTGNPVVVPRPGPL